MTEHELIEKLTKGIPKMPREVLVGVGDDCAVIEGNGFDWLVTTDALFEGIHFDFRYTSDYLLGRKSLSVNLSDIAAMGGRPLYYTISLGVPPKFDLKRLKAFYKGLNDVAKRYRVVLIGGDTCATKSGIAISITVLGKAGKDRAILRNGAHPGDYIFVTGRLGAAAMGLKKRHAPFLKRHNDPTPKIKAGLKLASLGCVTSMIDISDGLLSDLGHIVKLSHVGYELLGSKIPVAKGVESLELALTGGEDYELLFTASKKHLKGFTSIGRIIGDVRKKVVLDDDGKVMKFAHTGYDHFMTPTLKHFYT